MCSEHVTYNKLYFFEVKIKCVGGRVDNSDAYFIAFQNTHKLFLVQLLLNWNYLYKLFRRLLLLEDSH